MVVSQVYTIPADGNTNDKKDHNQEDGANRTPMPTLKERMARRTNCYEPGLDIKYKTQ